MNEIREDLERRKNNIFEAVKPCKIIHERMKAASPERKLKRTSPERNLKRTMPETHFMTLKFL